MKIVRILATGLLAIIGILLVMAAMKEKDFSVERSILISADPPTVYSLAADLGRWQEWSPWQKLDPAMKSELKGIMGEVGSSYSWTGNDEVGSGTMTIASLKENQEVEIDLQFITPWESKSKTYFLLEAVDGQTKFTWRMDGSNEGIVERLFALLMSMESMIAKDFDAGLTTLKNILEQSPPS